MVQNQMTPSYPQFTQTGIEEYTQAGAVPTQAGAPSADPQQQFKTVTGAEQTPTQPLTPAAAVAAAAAAAAAANTNGVEQQTVSVSSAVRIQPRDGASDAGETRACCCVVALCYIDIIIR